MSSRAAADPVSIAKAALRRERAATKTLPRSATPMSIDIVPLQDGRARLVDRATRQPLGTAVNTEVAGRTRDFFR